MNYREQKMLQCPHFLGLPNSVDFYPDVLETSPSFSNIGLLDARKPYFDNINSVTTSFERLNAINFKRIEFYLFLSIKRFTSVLIINITIISTYYRFNNKGSFLRQIMKIMYWVAKYFQKTLK